MKAILLPFLFISANLFAQCFYSFRDTMNTWQYWAFENGEFQLIETQEIRGEMRSWDYMVYIDKFENFKVFKDGKSHIIQKFPPERYHTTDQLMVWLNRGGFLNVFSEGENHDLGTWVERFWYGDSVVAYIDNFGFFRIFYNGESRQIETLMPTDVKVSDNIVSWFTPNGLFNIFHRGEIFTLEEGNRPISYKVDRDIVAFVDYMGVF